MFCSEMSESSRAGSAASRCTQLVVGSLNSATFIPSSLAFCCLEKIFLVEASEGNKISFIFSTYVLTLSVQTSVETMKLSN